MIFLIAGVLGLVAGTGMLIYSVLSLIGSFQPVAVMESPGAVQIQIDEPGVYTLWHDHDTTHNGVTVSHEPGLPPGFDYVLARDSDQFQFQLTPSRARTTLSTPGRNSVGVGTFQPDRAGSHTLHIAGPGAQSRIFSLTAGSFLGRFASFGLWIVLGVIVFLAGLLLLALGIVFMVVGPQAGAHPEPTPPGVPG